MSGFQQFIALGRLGQDVDLKYSQGGTAIARFSLATSRWQNKRGSDEKEEVTTWHSIKAFGKQAEVLGEHVKKGDQLFVEGRLENWKTTGSDGVTKYGTDVILEHFEFCGGGRGGGETRQSSPSRSQGAPAQRGAARPAATQRPVASRPAQAPADDLPFADDDIPF